MKKQHFFTTHFYLFKLILVSVTMISSEVLMAQSFTEQTSISLQQINSKSVAWGDYDNDGDLDILISGANSLNQQFSGVYKNNGNNSFTLQTGISLTTAETGSVSWGDYNNDGYLDILITGSTSNGYMSKVYKNNGNNTFTEQASISLLPIMGGNAEWGDYDNDGDLDILLSGYESSNGEISKLYTNNGNNTFTELTSLSMIGLQYGSMDWGDYNNDGALDFIIVGRDYNYAYYAKLYKNNGNGSFTENTSASYPGVYDGSVEWGDYDADGFIDLLITGQSSSGNIAKVYKNNGNGTFSHQSGIVLATVNNSDGTWGDYDNDGDLDILLVGSDNGTKLSKIFKNNGNNTFSDQTSIGLAAIGGAVTWGDYDNDGDLDIIMTGNDGSYNAMTKVYRNNLIATGTQLPNLAPNYPTKLSAEHRGDTVVFSWTAAIDSTTPASALSYNLRVGTSISAIDVNAPESDLSSGFHRVVEFGSIVDTNYTMVVDDSLLYWSVQAVDQGYKASVFAPVDSCVFYEASFLSSNDTLTNSPFILNLTNTSMGWYNSWVWSFGDGDFSSVKNPTHTYQYDGSYLVTLFASDTNTNLIDTISQLIVCDAGNVSPCNFMAELTQSQSSAMICFGDSIRLSATPDTSVTYQWFRTGVAIIGATDSIYFAKVPGFYMAVLSTSQCSKLTNNYFVLANYPHNETVISVVGSIAPCSNDSLMLQAPQNYTSYLWNNGKTTPFIYVNKSGVFSVQVSDNNLCNYNVPEKIINASMAQIPNICSVGADSLSNHAIIKWLAESSLKIDSFRIYREGSITNVYDYLSSVPYSISPSFIDVNSDLAVRQYTYRISAIDTCGMETPLSSFHKTLHLQVNAGMNNHWNLLWQAYEGFDFGSFKIYRGKDSLNMSLLTTLPSNIDSYTDITNPIGDVFYQIEIVSSSACQAKGGNSIVRSNTFNTKYAQGVGMNQVIQSGFNALIYPNPTDGMVKLSIQSSERISFNIEVYDLLGHNVYSQRLESNNSSQMDVNLSQLSPGLYLFGLIGENGLLYYTKLIIR